MNNLANLYFDGYGVTRDYQQARQWYEKAAAAGNGTAMYNLGLMYEKGNGVERDRQQAQQWYEKAAAAGDKDAVNRLKNWKE